MCVWHVSVCVSLMAIQLTCSIVSDLIFSWLVMSALTGHWSIIGPFPVLLILFPAVQVGLVVQQYIQYVTTSMPSHLIVVKNDHSCDSSVYRGSVMDMVSLTSEE